MCDLYRLLAFHKVDHLPPLLILLLRPLTFIEVCVRIHVLIMAASRSESQQPPVYGRKRSNTVTSVLKSVVSSSAIPVIPAIPIRTGDSKVLTLWVHDP